MTSHRYNRITNRGYRVIPHTPPRSHQQYTSYNHHRPSSEYINGRPVHQSHYDSYYQRPRAVSTYHQPRQQILILTALTTTTNININQSNTSSLNIATKNISSSNERNKY